MRPSMWLWRSLAAWNSAFSEMSPWARAISISWTILRALDALQALAARPRASRSPPGHGHSVCHAFSASRSRSGRRAALPIRGRRDAKLDVPARRGRRRSRAYRARSRCQSEADPGRDGVAADAAGVASAARAGRPWRSASTRCGWSRLAVGGLEARPLLFASADAARAGLHGRRDAALGLGVGAALVVAAGVLTRAQRARRARSRRRAGRAARAPTARRVPRARRPSAASRRRRSSAARSSRASGSWLASVLFALAHFVPRRELLALDRSSRFAAGRCSARSSPRPATSSRRRSRTSRQRGEPALARFDARATDAAAPSLASALSRARDRVDLDRAPSGSAATWTVARAGFGSLGEVARVHRVHAREQREVGEVDGRLHHAVEAEPAASSTARRFASTRSVCASMSPSTSLPGRGSSGIWPGREHQAAVRRRPASSGPTGVGAPA